MHIDNFALRLLSVIITLVFLANSPVHAQDSLQNTVEALQRETSEIKALLEEMKVEITRSRRRRLLCDASSNLLVASLRARRRRRRNRQSRS
jgi:RNase P subunit RPR2